MGGITRAISEMECNHLTPEKMHMIVRNDKILYGTMHTIERLFVKITIINVCRYLDGMEYSLVCLLCVVIHYMQHLINLVMKIHIVTVLSHQCEYGIYHSYELIN